jgi:hypothetical protein
MTFILNYNYHQDVFDWTQQLLFSSVRLKLKEKKKMIIEKSSIENVRERTIVE